MVIGLGLAVVSVGALALTWMSPPARRVEIEVTSDKVTYRPAENARITVDVRNLGDALSNLSLEFEITDPLGSPIHSENVGIAAIEKGGSRRIQVDWRTPTVNLSAFVSIATLVDAKGDAMASDYCVFDVAKNWTLVPRYGFFAIFPPWSEDVEGKVEQMASFHINCIQFYDWFELHGIYTPTSPDYAILNKQISRDKVVEKILAAQERGMKAMAYTAIYAAAEQIYRIHPEWALTDASGKPLRFVDWLYLVNPDRASGWHDYLIGQFLDSIGMFGWDGIHLDQYGRDWTKGARWNSSPVNMEGAFLAFVNDAASSMREAYPESRLIFNLVNAWPYETIAKRSMSDATYVEVWPPWDSYADIQALIRLGKTYNAKKAVILAAYTPNQLPTILLLDALIFSNQGFHIELGEGSGILVDPYFPLYQTLSEEAASALRTYYETITRYESYIYDPDVERLPADTVEVLNYRWSSTPRSGEILVIPYCKQSGADEEALTIHLVNFLGIENMAWKATQVQPNEASDVQVRVKIPADLIGRIEGIFVVDPDKGSSDPVPLLYEVDSADSVVGFKLPSLKYWSMVIVKFSSLDNKGLQSRSDSVASVAQKSDCDPHHANKGASRYQEAKGMPTTRGAYEIGRCLIVVSCCHNKDSLSSFASDACQASQDSTLIGNNYDLMSGLGGG